MNKFLIIGSDGYLGASFKKFLKTKKIPYIEYKYKDFYGNKTFKHLINKVDIIVHFAISGSLNKKKNFNHDLNFSENLFRFSKKNKIRCYYISSISAFRENKSFYSQLKINIEKKALKYGAKIIKPGMIWSNKPKSWFGNVNSIIDLTYILLPLIGNGERHIYMVYLDDFINNLFKICSNKNKVKFAVFNNETFSFRNLIKKICLKKRKNVIFLPIPSGLIYIFFKILYMLKILSADTYDSLQSYKYAKKHTFTDHEIIYTKRSFKTYGSKI